MTFDPADIEAKTGELVKAELDEIQQEQFKQGLVGNGTTDRWTAEMARVMAHRGREAGLQRKEEQRAAYEAAMRDLLGPAAELQMRIILAANAASEALMNPETGRIETFRANKEQLDLLKLGRQAVKDIADRGVGKVTQQIEIKNTDGLFTAMQELDEWEAQMRAAETVEIIDEVEPDGD